MSENFVVLMNIISYVIDLIMHLDTYLGSFIQTFGVWSYVLLFGIIFCETGLVVLPFLPGDSLLFAAGALAAIGSLNIWALFFVLCAAAILGDTINFWIGSFIGEKVFTEKSRFFKKEYFDRTHKFFDKYGSKTIILARFVPIIRTFAPFLAGVGKMRYIKFLIYNMIGGVLWISLLLFSGYYFCNFPFVKNNFSIVVIVIIIISLIPVFIEYYKSRKDKKK